MPIRSLTVCVLLTALVVTGPLAAANAEQVHVVNFPETQKIQGAVRLLDPVPQSKLATLNEQIVPPADPKDLTTLVDGGTLDAAGFVSVVLSLAGQIKANFFRPGEVGAILVPDAALPRLAFEEGNQILFPLRVAASAGEPTATYFASGQPSATLGFPRYKVYFYNTTDRPASVTLFAYLTN